MITWAFIFVAIYSWHIMKQFERSNMFKNNKDNRNDINQNFDDDITLLISQLYTLDDDSEARGKLVSDIKTLVEAKRDYNSDRHDTIVKSIAAGTTLLGIHRHAWI
jgi:hypothetical protein